MRSLFVVSVLLALNIGDNAVAQSSDPALADCTSGDQGRRFRGCAAIVDERPIKSKKRLVVALDGLCWSYHLQRDYARALEFCNEAIRLDPGYAYAYNNRGVAKRGLGDNSGALEDFFRALQIRPNFAVALKNRARTYVELGMLGAAELDIATLRVQRPNDTELGELENQLTSARATTASKGIASGPNSNSNPSNPTASQPSAQAAQPVIDPRVREAAKALGIPLPPMPEAEVAGAQSPSQSESLSEEDAVFMKASAFILTGNANGEIQFDRKKCIAYVRDAQKPQPGDFFGNVLALQQMQARMMNGDVKRIDYNDIDVSSIQFGAEMQPRADNQSPYAVQLISSGKTSNGTIKVVSKTYNAANASRTEIEADKETLKRAWTRIYTDFCKGRKPDF